MPRKLQIEIEDIPYPAQFLDCLKQGVPQVVEAIEKDNAYLENGFVKLGRVEGDLDVALFFLYWVSDINEIIGNLNLVIADMRNLPTEYVLYRGSPTARFYLLTRTFFYEFYRFRERHQRFAKEAAGRGYINKSDVAFLREAIQNLFKEAIELRNSLVHGRIIWRGRDHYDLVLLDHALSNNLGIQDIETGEMRDIGNTLTSICKDTADTLRYEGVRMSSFLQQITRVYADAAKVFTLSMHTSRTNSMD